MPKRKRDSDDDIETESISTGAQAQRIQYKLKQGTVKLGHAFKVAKGFERQKLGRRRKNALKEKSDKDVERIDAEIMALKTLDNSACAQHYLYKTLSKIKAVAESPRLPEEVIKPRALSTDTAALNVNARLCNSNPVKEALPGVLNEVLRALGVEAKDVGAVKKRQRKVKGQEDPSESVNPATSNGREGASQSGGHEISDFDGFSDSDDDLENFNDRLASSDNESGDDLADDHRAKGRALKSLATKPPHYDHAADLSLSESGSMSASPSPEPQKAPAPKKSAFLPSLTMGGYISGSGSDIDDDIDVAPKKNRRGQRARQQIWEKKFGTKAKHLQSENGKRNEGWDPKRGATDGSERRGQRKGGHATSKPKASSGVIGEKAHPDPKHRDDSGPIHPSWEAAKKAKERKEKPVAFQGKKITFD